MKKEGLRTAEGAPHSFSPTSPRCPFFAPAQPAAAAAAAKEAPLQKRTRTQTLFAVVFSATNSNTNTHTEINPLPFLSPPFSLFSHSLLDPLGALKACTLPLPPPPPGR